MFQCFDEVETSKRQKYSVMIGNIEQNYTVFAMSTFGCLSEAAETFVSDLVACYSKIIWGVGNNREMFKQQLQMKLQREVARMLLLAFVDNEMW